MSDKEFRQYDASTNQTSNYCMTGADKTRRMTEVDDELDFRLLDDAEQFLERVNYQIPKDPADTVAKEVYPYPKYSTVTTVHDLIDRMFEDLAIQSAHGGRPPDIGRNIVHRIRNLGGVGLIIADPEEAEFVVRAAQGGTRGRLDETDGIDHMLFDSIDDDEWGEQLTERLDDEALDRLLCDLVRHGHRDPDEVRELLDAME